MCFALQKCRKNLTVVSDPSVSWRFRKRQELSYPKGRDKVTLDKSCFNLYFLNHYKPCDFRKFLSPDAFKHVRLQNTFNRCKVHQILPLMVDYACFLVKCISYQSVMRMQKNYFLQDLARFLQVRKILQDFCDRAQFLAKMTLHPRILQELIFLQDLARDKFSVN